MIKAYTAANLQDAHILMGLLRGQGIAARIFNASAQGGMGEIPFTQTYPEIWIVDPADLQRARAVFEAFDRPTESGSDLRCPSCGEDNPRAFAVCWNCGTALSS